MPGGSGLWKPCASWTRCFTSCGSCPTRQMTLPGSTAVIIATVSAMILLLFKSLRLSYSVTLYYLLCSFFFKKIYSFMIFGYASFHFFFLVHTVVVYFARVIMEQHRVFYFV